MPIRCSCFRKRTSDEAEVAQETNKKLKKAESPPVQPAVNKRNSIHNFFKKLNPDSAKSAASVGKSVPLIVKSDTSDVISDNSDNKSASSEVNCATLEANGKQEVRDDISENLPDELVSVGKLDAHKSKNDCEPSDDPVKASKSIEPKVSETKLSNNLFKKKKKQIIESDTDVSVDVDEFVNDKEVPEKPAIKAKKNKKKNVIDSDSDITVDLDASNSPKKLYNDNTDASKRSGVTNLFKKKRKKIETVDSDSDVSVDLEELEQVRTIFANN